MKFDNDEQGAYIYLTSGEILKYFFFILFIIFISLILIIIL